MNRFEIMSYLLEKSLFFKLVCGAGNENPEEVKKLSFIYTLAGAKGMDVSANPEIVKSCIDGIDLALMYSEKINLKINLKEDTKIYI